MRNTAVGAVGLALSFACSFPVSAAAQTGAAPRALTPSEAEAHGMGLELAFACSPRRHNRATDSESLIERGAGPLGGTAVYFRSIEGTFLVLEEYDEDLDGHCLVLGWFGGPLEPGRYAIRQLAYETLEAELAAGAHSFYSMSAVRKSEENSMLVAESGTLEIETMQLGVITGSFEVDGFLMDGNDRAATVEWTGTFTAVEGEG